MKFVVLERSILHMNELMVYNQSHACTRICWDSLKYGMGWNEFRVFMCSINVIEMASFNTYISFIIKIDQFTKLKRILSFF